MESTDRQRAHRQAVNAWCLYDVGNSAFATTIIAAVFPVYFSIIATTPGEGLPPAYLGYASSGAMLLSACLAPFLGSISDVSGTRKRFLAFFTTLGIVATGLLFTVRNGDWLRALFLYAGGTVGFSSSMIFYDSLLPQLSEKGDTIDEISSRGYAFGYIGGGTLLAINILGIMLLPGTSGYRAAFLSVALWWLLFSIPVFRRVAEPPVVDRADDGVSVTIRKGVGRVVATFRDIRRYRELFLFLIAFWLYNDGVGTIMKLAAIYAAGLLFSPLSIIGALLLTQFVAAPFSILFGKLARKIGGKLAISVGLVWYCLVIGGAMFMTSSWHFWILAVAVGMAQGGVQAISRSTFGLMVPKGKSAEFFGFYDISSKFSGVAGPLFFGVITQYTGSPLPGIGTLLLFFLGGLLVLMKVDIEKGHAAARNETERGGTKRYGDRDS
ncbi:MAG: MFS transporter [Thermovirgaceae bacterium]